MEILNLYTIKFDSDIIYINYIFTLQLVPVVTGEDGVTVRVLDINKLAVALEFVGNISKDTSTELIKDPSDLCQALVTRLGGDRRAAGEKLRAALSRVEEDAQLWALDKYVQCLDLWYTPPSTAHFPPILCYQYIDI